MQIIIDVPEKLTCEGFERPFTEEEKNILIKAIGNGTPLDKIRAEITECAIPDFEYHGCGGSQKIVELEDVLEIIDKYKAESEDKE